MFMGRCSWEGFSRGKSMVSRCSWENVHGKGFQGGIQWRYSNKSDQTLEDFPVFPVLLLFLSLVLDVHGKMFMGRAFKGGIQ